MRREDADELIAARSGVMVVTLAPAAVDNERIAHLAHSGILVSIGHSEATAEEARAAFDAGARAATHLYNAMSQLGHRAPGLVGAALADPRIVCGFIADGFHVHETAGRVAFAAKGSNGIALVSDAMPPAAGGPPSYELQSRKVNQVGLKLTLEDGTLAGAAITMLDAVRYCVATLVIPLTDALRMATLTPARLLGVDSEHGRLAAGARGRSGASGRCACASRGVARGNRDVEISRPATTDPGLLRFPADDSNSPSRIAAAEKIVANSAICETAGLEFPAKEQGNHLAEQGLFRARAGNDSTLQGNDFPCSESARIHRTSQSPVEQPAPRKWS